MRNSKQFDEDLQLKNFDDLEKDFQTAKKYFECFNGKMKCEDVAKNYPGFCIRVFSAQDSILYLKYPTYKVAIFNRKMGYNEIEKILKPERNYLIYDESNVVSFPSLEPLKTTSIHCLCTNLSDNTELAERIMSALKKADIYSERWFASALYPFPIKVDEDGFFEIIHKQQDF